MSKTFITSTENFDKWMKIHEKELVARFGQNPDIIIERDNDAGTVKITEPDSERRKESLIDAIKEGE